MLGASGVCQGVSLVAIPSPKRVLHLQIPSPEGLNITLLKPDAACSYQGLISLIVSRDVLTTGCSGLRIGLRVPLFWNSVHRMHGCRSSSCVSESAIPARCRIWVAVKELKLSYHNGYI